MIQSLKGVQKNIAYLSIVEVKELDSLSKVYDNLLDDKFKLEDQIIEIKKMCSDKVASIQGEIDILTTELKRIDDLRNEVVQMDFKNKNKIKKYA